MILDLVRDQPDPSVCADVCIVGAGAAGIALAVECVRLGKQVTLLEAGGRDTEETSSDSLAGELGGQAYRGMQQGRARRLGGTTTLWGGQILELDAIDFERRHWVAGSGWPFCKETLQPYYKRALHLEGVASSIQQDADVWKRLKFSVPDMEKLEVYLSRWCPEPNFAKLHRTVLDGPDVSVWLHATGTEALCEDGHLCGIRARSACGRRAIFRAKQFIFCLGAIESTRFFLQPHAQTKPWSDARLLGCFFQDHIDSDAATLLPRDAAALHAVFDTIYLGGHKYSPKLRLSAESQRMRRLLNVGATLYSTDREASKLDPLKVAAKDVLHRRVPQLAGCDFAAGISASPYLARRAYRFVVQHRAYHSPSAAVHLRVHCEQQPLGNSKIGLTGERDAFGLLRACVHWRIAAQEIESIRCFVELAKQALARYATVVPHPDLLRQDSRFAESCEDSFHHMGGMRMHPSPQHGLVDLDLKVHGTSNCYVCSTAVFPCSGFSNPTHTLIALAARLAEHLA